MAGGVAFDDAVKLAKKIPALGVGIHFTLANGNPVLPPEDIPSLVTAEGIFHDNYVLFLKKYFSGKISLDEVRAELAAQLNKIRRAGLTLTHFDSHQHLHHVPGIIKIALELAAAENISAMRVADAKLFDGELKNIGQLAGEVRGLSIA